MQFGEGSGGREEFLDWKDMATRELHLGKEVLDKQTQG